MIKSDLCNGTRRCHVILTIENRNEYMENFRKQFGFWRDFFIAIVESSKKMKSSNVTLSFVVCTNRNISALVREMLSYNSLFVGQLSKINHSRYALLI